MAGARGALVGKAKITRLALNGRIIQGCVGKAELTPYGLCFVIRTISLRPLHRLSSLTFKTSVPCVVCLEHNVE